MNFTPTHRLIIGVLAFLFLNPLFGQNELACNDNVQVSLAATCTTVIMPDLVLENHDPTADYSVEILNALSQSQGNTVDNGNIGETLTVRVNLLNAAGAVDNFCWGTIVVEDKSAPTLTCPDVVISCTQSIESATQPTATDNCDTNPTVEITDQSTNTDTECIDATLGDNVSGTVIITQTFTAIDVSGNQSQACVRTVEIQRPAAIDFPEDIAWYCTQNAAFLNITEPTDLLLNGLVPNAALGDVLDATDIPLTNLLLPTTGSGQPNIAEGTYCNFGLSHSDDLLMTCGNSFKIIRTWAVLDWCSNSLVLFNDVNDNDIQDAGEEDNVQIIKVVDDIAPVITADDFTLSATIAGQHPQPCLSTGFIPFPAVTEDCNTVTTQIFTEVGEVIYTTEGGNIPTPGLAVGLHLITYVATDACGNTSELMVNLTIADDLTPTMVCDEVTQVALPTNGLAIVAAIEFDDGSNDNCGLDRFEVRRMSDNCSISGNTFFGDNVTFCCADIGQEVQVILRAYDYYNNFNECMIIVLTEDKLAPTKVTDVTNQTIDCESYNSNIDTALDIAEANNEINPQILIDFFGEPTYEDNCEVTVQYTYTRDVNNCGSGTITRQWSPIDASGNLGEVCQQTIMVNHTSDFVVEFPADIELNCGDETDIDYGEPTIYFDNCELIAVSFEDQQFDVVEDACFKIMRTHTVINWCLYDVFGTNVVVESPENQLPGLSLDPDGDKDNRTYKDGLTTGNFPTAQSDGFIQHTQVIKVTDEIAPSISVENDLFFGITSTVCSTTVLLPQATVTDCSDDITVTVFSDLGTGYGPFNAVEIGDYSAVYTATDNCGNTTNTQINFSVGDVKPPTPYCVSGLIVALMETGMVEVCAPALNAGGFDNCTASEDLIFTFDPDNPADTCRMFNCLSVNQDVDLLLYVIDEAGNFDACLVDIEIQDNQLICISRPEIMGVVTDATGESLEDVRMYLNAEVETMQMTNSAGEFQFTDLDDGADYTVFPTDEVAYDTDVTTFDLVLIRQHILGINVLDSPYKIIAADANNSQSVTTSDIIALRRVLLHLDEGLNNSPSRRFVPTDFNFPNPSDPWESDFPEIINFNNLSMDDNEANFIGIKIGDVN